MSCAVGLGTVGLGTEGLGAVVAQQGNEEQRLPPCGPKELRNVHHETSPERNVGAGIVFVPSRVFGNLYEIKACVFYQEPLNFKMSCDHVFFNQKRNLSNMVMFCLLSQDLKLSRFQYIWMLCFLFIHSTFSE